MPSSYTNKVNQLLVQTQEGDHEALDQLIDLLYPKLQQMAHSRLEKERFFFKGRHGGTIETDDLVQRALIKLKLLDADQVSYRNKSHIMAIASLCMKQILLDYARARGDQLKASVEELSGMPSQSFQGNGKLDEALATLKKLDPRIALVARMRIMGMKEKEIASILKTHETTVRRDWAKAKQRLYVLLTGKEWRP